MTEFVIEKALLTDVGRKRRHNEDFVGCFEPTDAEELASDGRLYIAADGVGGGAAGEVASEYAVKKVLHDYYQSTEPDLGKRLQSAIRAAHADLYEHVERNPELGRMGTTLVGAIVHGEKLIVGNVGDSRAYLIRNGEMRQITRDHSLVARMVEEGTISPEEAETHPRRNVLLRSLGVDPTVHPDIFEGQLQLGDQIVLCSDGLTRHVSDQEILDVVTRTRVDRAARQLVELANVRGGKDNISVILLRLTESVPLATLAQREAKRAELVDPELDDLHDTAHRRRTTTVPEQPTRTIAVWRPPVWMWPVLGVAIALLIAACALLIKSGLEGPLMWAGVAAAAAALALALLLIVVLLLIWSSRQDKPTFRLRELPGFWLLGGVLLAAAIILPVALLSRRADSPAPTLTPATEAATASPPAPTQESFISPLETPTSAPSSTPTPLPPTDTVAPTSTDTAVPTLTPSPTATETPTPTSTETGTPTPTPTPTSTATPLPLPANPSLGDKWTRPADSMEMVYVPGGEFVMGSSDEQVDQALALCSEHLGDCQRSWFENEQPAHAVTLVGFWLDRTEVSNAQYRQCVEAGGCQPPEDPGSSTRDLYYNDEQYDDYPVIWVSWPQAAAYCTWTGGRLPTEAEWEYAARDREGRVFPWGDAFDIQPLNYCDANCALDWADEQVDDGYEDTAPVGSYADGVSWCSALDMAGNVWEWVADWYSAEYYSQSPEENPTGPETGDSRVLRGGSWHDNPGYIRGANRFERQPDAASDQIGFRCVRSSE